MDLSHVNAFKSAVISNFRYMKSAQTIKDVYLRAIPIEDDGFLIPIAQAHLGDQNLLKALTAWRNENVFAYPTQFVASLEGTRTWLEKGLLATEGRILFLVVDTHGNWTGHIGYNNCLNDQCAFEIDNVVRGAKGSAKGLYSKAMSALIEWARRTINVDTFYLRVFEDNKTAVAFYERNGFASEKRIPLKKTETEDMVSFVETHNPSEADQKFLMMIRKPETSDIGRNMILTAGPSISMKEANYAYDAALEGWNSNWSKYLVAFEKKFAEYVNAEYAIATSSCTGALQIALMALDIGPGDEVIVPDQTWVATANAVQYAGATPIFADIELDSWNLDAHSVENLITNRTKAIMPVHMYGHPTRMTRIKELADANGLKIIEDAAPAIGAEWQGKRCGSFGEFAGFSFQGAKLLVTGEGGMLVTNDETLYKKARKIWDQGRNPNRTFWIDENGVKFKMSNVQAAVGLAQLERADELVAMKRRVFSWYEGFLSGTPHIRLNKEVEGARSIYWMTSIFLDEDAPIGRDELIAELKKRNIDTRPVFPAISQYPIWKTSQHPQKNAMRVGKQAMNLPSGVCLQKEEIEYICRNIRELVDK